MNDTLNLSQRVLQEKQNKVKPENIKKDVTMFGITGTLEEGTMTQQEYNNALNTINDILGEG